MSIENTLESIAKSLAALVQLASAGTAKAETSEAAAPAAKKPGKPAKKTEAPKASEPDADDGGDPFDSEDEAGGDDAFGDDGDSETEKELTTDDVRAALTDLQKRTDAATAIEIMKKHGGTNSLSKIPAEKFQAVIDAAKKQTKKIAKS